MTTIAADTDRRQIDLYPGEIVDLRITGAVVAYTHDGRTSFNVGDATNGRRDIVSVDVNQAYVTVERGTPFDGEPQSGDLWRDAEGALYFAAQYGDLAVVLYSAVVPNSDRLIRWQEVHAGPTGPIRLECRPARQPEPEPDEDGSSS